jgi:hypothetical protein
MRIELMKEKMLPTLRPEDLTAQTALSEIIESHHNIRDDDLNGTDIKALEMKYTCQAIIKNKKLAEDTDGEIVELQVCLPYETYILGEFCTESA